MSSSMKARQKFLEQKFDGNRRLAQEFVYIQDPSVTQLQKWQVWKKEAEAEDRWTSWQTEDRAKTAIRKEPFRDPFLTRRKKRHRHRVATKGPYDVEREVGLVESTESLAWEVKVKQDKIAAMLKGLPPPPLPPAPAKLLAFAVTEKVVKKLHSLEPPDHQYYDPDDESVIINQPGSSKKKKKDKKKKKKEVSQSHKKVGDYRKREEESLSPSNLVYRFRLWWNGYYAATNCQRIVRGYLARQWVSLRIYEVRALIRRRAVYKVQRLYRGYRGRVAYRLHFIKLTSAALFIQRAYRSWSITRARAIRLRRHWAASKIQRSWYKLNSMLLAFRLLGMVRNKKDAAAAKDGFIAMYWGALRLQMAFKRNLARKRYRRMKALELMSAIRVQAFVRALLVRKVVKKVLAEKFEKLHDNRGAAHAVLRKFFLSRLIGIRMDKASKLRYASVVRLQAWQRGRSARKFDTRLRMQAALVRNWLSAFKEERVLPLMNAEQAPNFYSQVDPLPASKERPERHRKTGASDLPKAIREGPLFDHTAVPDYAAQARSDASQASLASMMDGNSSLDSNSPRGSSVNTAASPLSVFHAHVVRHTTGVIIEPTSNAHLEMLNQNQVPVASITGFELTHGGSLDKVLEKRHRTVSRGRPRKEGLSRAWDAIIDDDGEGFDHTETSQFELKRSQSASNSTKVKKRRDFGAVHVVIDKGDCVYKGNLSAKNLDVKS
mmetsp:Transcript_17023/g.22081  ORF Transcript_17023/g.22081 Transcript_17023/m.22081 type:complete len:718 (-) Transcript_17023:271-2424(-)